MAGYLDDYRAKVRAAHDPSKRTCHWTVMDELDAQAKGPCNCPEPPPDQPCSEHHKYDCENTDGVLNKHPASEMAYAPDLVRVKQWIETLYTGHRNKPGTLDKAKEIIDSFTKGLTKPSEIENATKEALNSGAMKSLMNSHFLANDVQAAIDGIINLKLPVEPAPGYGRGGDCECYEHKKGRLSHQKSNIRLVLDSSTIVSDLLDDKWPSFDPRNWRSTVSALIPAVTAGLAIAAAIAAPEASALAIAWAVVKNAGKAIAKPVAATKSGGKAYQFVWLVHWLGMTKAETMLEIIYHDQQHMSLTCQPRHGGEHEGSIGGGTEDEDISNGAEFISALEVITHALIVLPSDVVDRLADQTLETGRTE